MKAGIVAIALLLCASQLSCTRQRPKPESVLPDDLWIVNALVVDVAAGKVDAGLDLLIREGKINKIRSHGELTIPPDIRTLDASGAYLIPGLFDMYQHSAYLDLSEASGPIANGVYKEERTLELLRLQLKHGITTVRNFGSPLGVGVKLRDRQAAGRIIAPRLVTSDRILERLARHDLINVPVSTPADVRTSIREQRALGVDFIASYAAMTPELTAAAVDECRTLGTTLACNPQKTSWKEAAHIGVTQFFHGADWSGQTLPVEHRDRYRHLRETLGGMKARLDWMELLDLEGPAFLAMVTAIRDNGVIVTPTMMASAAA